MQASSPEGGAVVPYSGRDLCKVTPVILHGVVSPDAPLETPPRARGGVSRGVNQPAPICLSPGARGAGGASLSTTTPDTCPRDDESSPQSPPATRSSEPGLAGSLPGEDGPRSKALGLGGVPPGAKQGEMQGTCEGMRLAEIVWRAPGPLVLKKYQRPIALLVRTPPHSDVVIARL